MPSHSIVQSVLLRRSAFKTVDEAKKWITEHGYKYTLPDVTPTYYRFRQHDPAPLALTHRLRTTQLGEPDKMSPMGSVGALIIAYPKTSSPLAPNPPAPAGPAAAGGGPPPREFALPGGGTGTITGRSKVQERAEKLVKKAPLLMEFLNRHDDLLRIVNESATEVTDDHYMLKGDAYTEPSVSADFDPRNVSPTPQLLAQFYMFHPDQRDQIRRELRVLNKALEGVTVGVFQFKTSSAKTIKKFPVKVGDLKTVRSITFFGYKGTPSDDDKNLLRHARFALYPSMESLRVGDVVSLSARQQGYITKKTDKSLTLETGRLSASKKKFEGGYNEFTYKGKTSLLGELVDTEGHNGILKILARNVKLVEDVSESETESE